MSVLIEETLTRVRSGPRSGVMPKWEIQVRGTPIGILAGREETSQVSGPRVLTPLFDAHSVSAPPSATMSRPGEVPPWWASRRAALGAASGAALLLVMLVTAVVTGGHKREAAPPSEATLAAAGVSAPAPHDVPDRVDVVVRVSPASAQITIDGSPIPSNPFHARYAKDAQVHHVLASADGYEAKLEEVFFANDVSIDISLDRRANAAARYFAPVATPSPGKRPPAAVAEAQVPAGEATAAAVLPPARVEAGPAGGHAPLRPIMTSNPYGTP